MPKLWDETIAAHRGHVHDAIVDTTAALVFEHGLRSVTMAQIAKQTGIGRATLYKYFPDVEAILHAWHHRQITAHLAQLTAARDSGLPAVLRAYAQIRFETRQHHNTEIGHVLHRDQPDAHRQLHKLITDVIAESDDVRDDVPAAELATYCLHALGTARALPSRAAVARLVTVTLDGLRATN